MAGFYGSDIDNSQSGGFDNYYGGDGRDFLQGNATPNAVYGGEGNDVVNGSGFTTFSGAGTLVSPFVLTAFGPSGNDYLEGGSGDDVAYGADGDDVIYGGDGNESGIITSFNGQVFVGGLFGGEGADLIDGGRGNDLLDGGTGADDLRGGSGNDVYIVDNALDVVREAIGDGSDSVRSTVSYSLDINAEVEGLETTDPAGFAAINLTGSKTANTIIGNAGANILRGLDGNDLLFGLGSNDDLFGGNGNDQLFGGDGNDELFGGLGNDSLTGGAGNDIFYFNSLPNKTTNVDRVLDFNRPTDLFRIDNAVFKKVGSNGALKADAFILGKHAADAEDRIIYDKSTGNLFYDDDGTGAHAAIRIAILTNKATVGLNDFVVI